HLVVGDQRIVGVVGDDAHGQAVTASKIQRFGHEPITASLGGIEVTDGESRRARLSGSGAGGKQDRNSEASKKRVWNTRARHWWSPCVSLRSIRRRTTTANARAEQGRERDQRLSAPPVRSVRNGARAAATLRDHAVPRVSAVPGGFAATGLARVCAGRVAAEPVGRAALSGVGFTGFPRVAADRGAT